MWKHLHSCSHIWRRDLQTRLVPEGSSFMQNECRCLWERVSSQRQVWAVKVSFTSDWFLVLSSDCVLCNIVINKEGPRQTHYCDLGLPDHEKKFISLMIYLVSKQFVRHAEFVLKTNKQMQEGY